MVAISLVGSNMRFSCLRGPIRKQVLAKDRSHTSDKNKQFHGSVWKTCWETALAEPPWLCFNQRRHQKQIKPQGCFYHLSHFKNCIFFGTSRILPWGYSVRSSKQTIVWTVSQNGSAYKPFSTKEVLVMVIQNKLCFFLFSSFSKKFLCKKKQLTDTNLNS